MGPLGFNRITSAIQHTAQTQIEQIASSELAQRLTHSGVGKTSKAIAAKTGAAMGQATDTLTTEFAKGLTRQADAFRTAKTAMDRTFTEGAWVEPVAAAGSLAGVGVAALAGQHELAALAGAGLMATTWPKEAVNQAVLKASSTLKNSADLAFPFAATSSTVMAGSGLATDTFSALALLPVGLSVGISKLGTLAEQKLINPVRIATMNAETMYNATLKAKAGELGPWQKTVGFVADNPIIQGVEKRALEHLEALTGTTSGRLDTIRGATNEKAGAVAKAIKHELVPNDRLITPAEQYVHNTADMDPAMVTLVNQVLMEPVPLLGGPTEAQRKAMGIIEARNMAAANPLFAPALGQVEVPNKATRLTKLLGLVGVHPEETAAQKAAKDIGGLAKTGDKTAKAYTAGKSPTVVAQEAVGTRIGKVQGNIAKKADDPLVLLGRKDLVTALNGRSDLAQVSHGSIDSLARSRNAALQRLTEKEHTIAKALASDLNLQTAQKNLAQTRKEALEALYEEGTLVRGPNSLEKLADRVAKKGVSKGSSEREINNALARNADYGGALTAVAEKRIAVLDGLHTDGVISLDEGKAIIRAGEFKPVAIAKAADPEALSQALVNDTDYRLDVARFAQKHGTESVNEFTNPEPTMGGIHYLLAPATVSLKEEVAARQAKDLAQDFKAAFNL